MRDVLMEMVKDSVDEKVNAKEQETKAYAIRNVMDSFGVTIERAMDVVLVWADISRILIFSKNIINRLKKNNNSCNISHSSIVIYMCIFLIKRGGFV